MSLCAFQFILYMFPKLVQIILIITSLSLSLRPCLDNKLDSILFVEKIVSHEKGQQSVICLQNKTNILSLLLSFSLRTELSKWRSERKYRKYFHDMLGWVCLAAFLFLMFPSKFSIYYWICLMFSFWKAFILPIRTSVYDLFHHFWTAFNTHSISLFQLLLVPVQNY